MSSIGSPVPAVVYAMVPPGRSTLASVCATLWTPSG